MKLKLDLNASDLSALNNPDTEGEVMAQAYDMLKAIFEKKDELIKCSITMDDKE